MCLTLSLLAFRGRGDHFETFACTKKKKTLPFIPLFIFLGAKKQCLMSSPSWDF